MNCKVCGSSEFITNDGITYCSECQSQIEETQTEVAVELSFSRNIDSSAQKKTPTQKSKEYSDCITVECFNHILFMQVTALIKLGSSPKLKNTVLHIWSKYLQKCEIAFRIDYRAESGKPLLGPVPYKRDIDILYGNEDISKHKQNKLEMSDCESSVLEDTDGESETNSKTSVLFHKKSYYNKNYSSHAKKLLKTGKLTKVRRRSYIKRVFHMTLAKTLSICYLGLLYTEDQLSLCDLIRLVYEKKIPFLNLLNELPSTLKMQASDRMLFLTYTVPDAYSILKTSREIVQFVKLPEFKEPSVFIAASRLVKDLNLPGDMIPIVKTLADRYKDKLSNYSSIKLENVPHEVQALAYILVAMKMLFVLDDKFEIEHSKIMNKLNILHPDHVYFEWKEWMEHSVVKEYLFLCEKPDYYAVNKLDSLSADTIISKYPYNQLKSLSSEDLENHWDVTPIKHSIKKMLSDIIVIPRSNPTIPTSFPLRRAIKCFIEEWQTLPMFKETQKIDFNLLKKDFSSCSLSYNPSQFNQEEDELSYLLMTSLYFPTLSENITKNFPVPYCHQVVCSTSKYWFLNLDKHKKIDGSLLPCFDKLPNSFKWLINFVSKYAYCNNIMLYREVVRIEKTLFLQKQHICKNTKLTGKINIDF